MLKTTWLDSSGVSIKSTLINMILQCIQCRLKYQVGWSQRVAGLLRYPHVLYFISKLLREDKEFYFFCIWKEKKLKSF